MLAASLGGLHLSGCREKWQQVSSYNSHTEITPKNDQGSKIWIKCINVQQTLRSTYVAKHMSNLCKITGPCMVRNPSQLIFGFSSLKTYVAIYGPVGRKTVSCFGGQKCVIICIPISYSILAAKLSYQLRVPKLVLWFEWQNCVTSLGGKIVLANGWQNRRVLE